MALQTWYCNHQLIRWQQQQQLFAPLLLSAAGLQLFHNPCHQCSPESSPPQASHDRCFKTCQNASRISYEMLSTSLICSLQAPKSSYELLRDISGIITRIASHWSLDWSHLSRNRGGTSGRCHGRLPCRLPCRLRLAWNIRSERWLSMKAGI